MFKRTIQAVLFVLAVGAMIVPLACQNVSSAGGGAKPVAYNLYFGDLHSHTSYSDGWEGTPWDAFKAAKDGGADYFAVTDHVTLWNAYSGLTLDSEEWADTLAAADYYTSEDFVAMAGYEAWLLARLGEINVYNVRELPPLEPLGYKWDRLPDLYDWLVSNGAIGQYNHPYYMTKDFENYDYYTAARDSAMNILEVWNAQLAEDSYVMALDAGWHVMPSVNSDTHNPDWISGYEMRTVLLAPSLTPENLYAAMNACRGYGTLDKNLRVQYMLNGAAMGSVLMPSSSYKVSIQVSDPDGAVDAIKLVEIVSDGGVVVASKKFNSADISWSTSLTSSSASYYYVRVTTDSGLDGLPGLTAWTAPVWTGS